MDEAFFFPNFLQEKQLDVNIQAFFDFVFSLNKLDCKTIDGVSTA